MARRIQSFDQDQKMLRRFTGALLRDLDALERMLDEGLIESGRNRIGAEQELFIVDQHLQPAPLADTILQATDQTHFTNELARYNLEINLDPIDFRDDCLSKMEAEIQQLISILNTEAGKHDARILLTGILPTIQDRHLKPEFMSPKPRYQVLENALRDLRGREEYSFQITGVDDLQIRDDSVMVEACNTSFQVHFQVSPEHFPRWYNIAQVVAAPVLAAAVNSPLLYNRRLWRETRIAIFQRTLDTRTDMPIQRRLQPRVNFGQDWVKQSILDIFREDLSRFPVMFATEITEDPFEILQNADVPSLEALTLYNGSIYRWNRACYGVYEGNAHLRIENRMLPSGPTARDEIANAAFWYGLICGLNERYDDIISHISFEQVKDNFISAARHGLTTEQTWLDGRRWSVRDLIRKELLPIAEAGLKQSGIQSGDIDTYLTIIDERVASGQTGARWQLDSLENMKDTIPSAGKMSQITAAMLEWQSGNIPGHRWSLAETEPSKQWIRTQMNVSQWMNTDITTIRPDDSLELAGQQMVWNDLRIIPVEDKEHRLMGVVSYHDILQHHTEVTDNSEASAIPVRAVMTGDPITVSPTSSILGAVRLMEEHSLSSLPVVEDGQLVGLLTENVIMQIAGQLLETRDAE